MSQNASEDGQRKLDEEDAAILLRRVQDMGEAVRLAKAERLTNRRTARREKRLVLALQGRLYQLARLAGDHASDIAEISRALRQGQYARPARAGGEGPGEPRRGSA